MQNVVDCIKLSNNEYKDYTTLMNYFLKSINQGKINEDHPPKLVSPTLGFLSCPYEI